MKPVAIIGAGPAGLMAAEVISAAGIPVDLFDAMPSPGRKFLRAGVGGLNLTHSEPLAQFEQRYREAQPVVARWLAEFGPDAVRDWAHSLGVDTFIGSSGRVFPAQMKGAPLLRSWLKRLHAQGVRLHLRHRWQGWRADGRLSFRTPHGEREVGGPEGIPFGTGETAYPLGMQSPAWGTAATVLALGGASWARLGSDGMWATPLAERGIALNPFLPANIGVEVPWSAHLVERYAGQALKGIRLSIGNSQRLGECMITRHGLEGGVIYALGVELRTALQRAGQVTIHLDLMPDRSLERVLTDLHTPRGRDSLANHLRRQLRLQGAKAALLREFATKEQLHDLTQLAGVIKALPVIVTGLRPLDEAISSAGGIRLDQLTELLMLKTLPGVFCAGEMLDWEAPTGGYLLTACLASGHVAGQGVLRHVRQAIASA